MKSEKEGEILLQEKISNGEAAQVFCKMAAAQGVDEDVAKRLCDKDTDVWTILPKAKHFTDVRIEKSGK